MTKARAPLTIDAALARIAGTVDGGWPTMAAATGRQDRTVRNWGDPDTRESVPFDCAIALDLLYQAHGGEGAPLFEAYGYQLELAQIERFGCQIELANSTRISIFESGEAHAALVNAAMPGATEVDRAAAVKEGEEAIIALQAAVMKAKRGEAAQQPP